MEELLTRLLLLVDYCLEELLLKEYTMSVQEVIDEELRNFNLINKGFSMNLN